MSRFGRLCTYAFFAGISITQLCALSSGGYVLIGDGERRVYAALAGVASGAVVYFAQTGPAAQKGSGKIILAALVGGGSCLV